MATSTDQQRDCNGDEQKVHTLYQKDTHKGIILSSPLLLSLKEGINHEIGGLKSALMAGQQIR
jgi:hypothetical protein